MDLTSLLLTHVASFYFLCDLISANLINQEKHTKRMDSKSVSRQLPHLFSQRRGFKEQHGSSTCGSGSQFEDTSGFGAISIRPEKINKFPSMMARLLASLTSTARRGNGLAWNWDMKSLLHGDNNDRRRRRQASVSLVPLPTSRSNSSDCVPVEPSACRDVPFDALVSQEDVLLAFKNGNIHKLASNGSIISRTALNRDVMFPMMQGPVTGALRMRDFIYIFLDTVYMKFRPEDDLRRFEIPVPIPISVGFHGAPSPVSGAFQLNSHTFVLITGSSFVFYQPDGKPPVNPKFNPNVLASITGGPATVSTAFNTPDGRRFFVSAGNLMELDDKMQIINVQPFKRTSNNAGWLDCRPVAPPGCIDRVQSMPFAPKLSASTENQSQSSAFDMGEFLPQNQTTVMSADTTLIPMTHQPTSNPNSTLPSEPSVHPSSIPHVGTSSPTSTIMPIVPEIPVTRQPENISDVNVSSANKTTVIQIPPQIPGHLADDGDRDSGHGDSLTVSATQNGTSQDPSKRPSESPVVVTNLNDHAVVLKDLMDKLSNLTHALTSIPAHSQIIHGTPRV